MVQLITAKGQEIACMAVIRATNYNFLTIHTDTLSRVEIDQIFDDPEETAVLTAIDQIPVPDERGNETVVETSRTFRGWTVLDTVQRSPLYEGALMIWLMKPEED